MCTKNTGTNEGNRNWRLLWLTSSIIIEVKFTIPVPCTTKFHLLLYSILSAGILHHAHTSIHREENTPIKVGIVLDLSELAVFVSSAVPLLFCAPRARKMIRLFVCEKGGEIKVPKDRVCQHKKKKMYAMDGAGWRVRGGYEKKKPVSPEMV